MTTGVAWVPLGRSFSKGLLFVRQLPWAPDLVCTHPTAHYRAHLPLASPHLPLEHKGTEPFACASTPAVLRAAVCRPLLCGKPLPPGGRVGGGGAKHHWCTCTQLPILGPFNEFHFLAEEHFADVGGGMGWGLASHPPPPPEGLLSNGLAVCSVWCSASQFMTFTSELQSPAPTSTDRHTYSTFMAYPPNTRKCQPAHLLRLHGNPPPPPPTHKYQPPHHLCLYGNTPPTTHTHTHTHTHIVMDTPRWSKG